MGFAALLLCGTVNATSWRVCSKPEAGANFLTVRDAVQSLSVHAGDTLYIEPGHIEIGDHLQIQKRVILIGPGFSLIENAISAINPDEAIFATSSVGLDSAGINVYGCKFITNLSTNTSSHIIENCFFTAGLNVSGSNQYVRGCFFNNCNLHAIYQINSSTFENNIFNGIIDDEHDIRWDEEKYENCIFRNNTVVSNSQYVIVSRMINCELYNNIFINSNENYSTTVNSDQTVDTTWYRDIIFDAPESRGNYIHHNVLSCHPNNEYMNCVFNATIESSLIWNNANTLEEKYKHLANGSAVGAGVNGTTCGAYGAVNGSRAYQPAGIPQYRPYIYDATIDDTPNANNTINASFKIKVQQ